MVKKGPPAKAAPKPQSKSEAEKLISQNKRAGFDYHIEKRIEAGVVLQGSEVKSCRDGRVQLVDSYATIEKGEIYLMKAHIAEYKEGGPFFNHVPQRRRKLMLHKREIRNLGALLEQQGYTLVPTRMYFKRGRVKVELGLAKGKTKGDKRETSRTAESDRRIRQATRRNRNED